MSFYKLREGYNEENFKIGASGHHYTVWSCLYLDIQIYTGIGSVFYYYGVVSEEYFEIKKYHNRNLYLALSAVFSIAWLISTGIWVLSQDQALNNVLAIAAGLLILSTFILLFQTPVSGINSGFIKVLNSVTMNFLN